MDIFPPDKRGRVVGIIGAVFGIAFIIGPIIAGILLSYFKWNALFLINLPVVLILILASYRYLPSIRVKSAGLFDWKGILTLALMLASFTYCINKLKAGNFIESLISGKVLPFLLFAVLMFLFNQKNSSGLCPGVKRKVKKT